MLAAADALRTLGAALQQLPDKAKAGSLHEALKALDSVSCTYSTAGKRCSHVLRRGLQNCCTAGRLGPCELLRQDCHSAAGR